MKRVIWIVLDSVGMGELPDADRFGDVGANTIASAAQAVSNFDLPYMRMLGYGNIDGMKGVKLESILQKRFLPIRMDFRRRSCRHFWNRPKSKDIMVIK